MGIPRFLTRLKDANAAPQHLVTSLQNERALLLLQSSRVPQVGDSGLGSDVPSRTVSAMSHSPHRRSDCGPGTSRGCSQFTYFYYETVIQSTAI